MCRLITLWLLAGCFLGTGASLAQSAGSPLSKPPGSHVTLSGEFTRVLETETRSETMQGSFYYLEPGRIHFEIAQPIKQILLVQDNVITIYYPDHNKGFILEGKAPVLLPMIPALTAAARPDYGLTDLGYQIYDQALHGDTLLTYWNHPAGEELGRFRLAKAGERLAYAVFEPPDAVGEILTTFETFTTVSGLPFPTEIRTENVNLSSEGYEVLRLTKIEVNPEIPARVSTFRLPSDAIVEKKRM